MFDRNATARTLYPGRLQLLLIFFVRIQPHNAITELTESSSPAQVFQGRLNILFCRMQDHKNAAIVFDGDSLDGTNEVLISFPRLAGLLLDHG